MQVQVYCSELIAKSVSIGQNAVSLRSIRAAEILQNSLQIKRLQSLR